MSVIRSIFLTFLFYLYPFLIIAQSNYSNRTLYVSTQITFEEQSYLERSFHDSRYFDVEKSAGICTTYNLMFHKGLPINQRFSIKYGLGLGLISQEYDISEMSSSGWDFFEMGSSTINNLYLITSAKLFYNKPKSNSIYLSPFLGFGVNYLVAKDEKLISKKAGFDTLIDPKFSFKKLVSEFSMGFLCFYIPKNIDYGFAIGPSINNNAKYFHEPLGILTFPISFSMNFTIIKIQ